MQKFPQTRWWQTSAAAVAHRHDGENDVIVVDDEDDLFPALREDCGHPDDEVLDLLLEAAEDVVEVAQVDGTRLVDADERGAELGIPSAHLKDIVCKLLGSIDWAPPNKPKLKMLLQKKS